MGLNLKIGWKMGMPAPFRSGLQKHVKKWGGAVIVEDAGLKLISAP